MGSDEQQFRRNCHISLEMIYQITLMDREALALSLKLFGLLQVQDAAPLGLSQQYETQENLPD